MRNSSQYPDFESPEVTDMDVQWAINLAGEAVAGVQSFTTAVSLGRYQTNS